MGKIIVAAAVSAGVLVLAHGALGQQPAQPGGIDPYHMIGRYAAEAMAATEQVAQVRQQAQAIVERDEATRTWWANWWKGVYGEPAPVAHQTPIPPK